MARSLRALGQSAFHVYDVGLTGLSDELVLRYAGERGWLVVSSDRSILTNPQERVVIFNLRIGTFFLNDTLRGECTIARVIYRHWPEMKRLSRRERRPFLYLVTERRMSRIWKRGRGLRRL